MSRIICIVGGEMVTEASDGSVYYTSTAHVDNDGPNGNPERDKCHQETTSLRHADGSSLDGEVELYVVVPPVVIRGVRPIVLGCTATVEFGGKRINAVVGDVGPSIGELSVACARALGMDPSPIRGGVDTQCVHYTIYPGVAASGYQLQRSP